MKKIIATIAVAAMALLSVVSCTKEFSDPAADTSSIRMALTPDPGTIPAAGSNFESVVTVHIGSDLNVDWNVSVDFEPSWVVVEKVDITTDFVGTYAGDDKKVNQKGISVFVTPNSTGAKRTATLRFTTDNGSSVTYTLTQNK